MRMNRKFKNTVNIGVLLTDISDVSPFENLVVLRSVALVIPVAPTQDQLQTPQTAINTYQWPEEFINNPFDTVHDTLCAIRKLSLRYQNNCTRLKWALNAMEMNRRRNKPIFINLPHQYHLTVHCELVSPVLHYCHIRIPAKHFVCFRYENIVSTQFQKVCQKMDTDEGEEDRHGVQSRCLSETIRAETAYRR